MRARSRDVRNLAPNSRRDYENKATATSRQEQRPGLLLTQTHWEGGQRGAGSAPCKSPAGVSWSGRANSYRRTTALHQVKD